MLRLVRESSELPNIANRDDTCFIRHAYGSDGYVPNYGNDMQYAVPNTQSFRIQGGRVNLQGWEIDIDNYLIPINLESFTGVRYDFVYLEINLLSESVQILTVRDADTVFPLNKGDDLTFNPNGVARIALYRIPVNSSGIVSASTISMLIKPIQRSGSRFDSAEMRLESIEHRLDLLGFKDGVFSWEQGMPDEKAEMSRQGNYVIGSAKVSYAPSVLPYSNQSTYVLSDGTSIFAHRLGRVPITMKPKEILSALASVGGYNSVSGYTANEPADVLIDTSGYCYLTINNSNWNIVTVYISFGYEAAPLT